MNFKELYESFQPDLSRLEHDQVPLHRIVNIFNSFCWAKINQAKHEQERQTTLKDADDLFGI